MIRFLYFFLMFIDKNAFSDDVAKKLFDKKMFYSSFLTYKKAFSNQKKESKNGKKESKHLISLDIASRKITVSDDHIRDIFREIKKEDTFNFVEKERDFFHFYSGRLSFSDEKYADAYQHFSAVSKNGFYHNKSLFYLSVLSSMDQKIDISISQLKMILEDGHTLDQDFMDQVYLNLARLFYEKKDYNQAISYYAKIQKKSQYWLEALEEAAWAFYVLEKSNNSLGNLHTVLSPFFETRFHPDSFVVQASNYVKLCLFQRAKDTIDIFDKRYKKLANKIDQIPSNDPLGFLQKISSLKKKEDFNYFQAIDFIMRNGSSDFYQTSSDQIQFELSILEKDVTLSKEVDKSLMGDLKKEKEQIKIATQKMIKKDLLDLKEKINDSIGKIKLIQAEMMLGKVQSLRVEVDPNAKKKEETFIGEMIPLSQLKISQELEYFPFYSEYWFDELGGYVYNTKSHCNTKGGESL